MSNRLLLVEDEPTNAMMIRLICERSGYHVIHACNGQEALDLLDRHRIDLILMDVRMPVMDGIEATKRIRSNPRTAHLPVIFVTAMVSPGAVAEMKSLNPIAIITKPFELQGLIDMIKESLNRQPGKVAIGHHLDHLMNLSSA